MTDAKITVIAFAPLLTQIEVRKGDWLVSDLKAAIGYPAYKAISRVDPFGLTELADDATVDVRDGERFISHVRPGVST